MRRWWGILGVPLALLGAVYGTAASPDYPMVLTRWAVLTLFAVAIFSVAIMQNRDGPRWIYVACLALTCALGIDPALRLIRILFGIA